MENLNDFDDEKSTISEISEEIMVDSTIERSTRSKSLSYLNNNLESESTETSSSTDTQILLLNRTPRNQTSTKNELEANNDKGKKFGISKSIEYSILINFIF